MLSKTRAIILHHIKYGESSLIITLYTEKYGRIACIVNGTRTKKSKFPISLFQPLNLVETDFYFRQNREIQRMKEASGIFHYNSLPFDTRKSTVALFLAEVLYLTLREEEQNDALFSYLFHALQLFDLLKEGLPIFHLWFMLQLSKYLGFFPVVPSSWDTKIHDDMSIFDGISDKAQNALQKMVQNYQSPPIIDDLSRTDRNDLLGRIIKYYNLHVDGFSRLRSYSVLQEVFK